MSRRDRERSASATAPALVTQGLLAASAEPPAEPAPEASAPPREPAPVPTRYRVRGPGMIAVRGRTLSAGKVVDLSPAEAASLADHVDPLP